MFKRILVFALSAVLALSTAACSGESPSPEDTTISAQTTTAETTTEETQPMPELPSTTYDGVAMRFLTYDGDSPVVRYYSEVYAESTNGETMNDAIFERNQRIEETYQVKITEDKIHRDDQKARISASITAGEDNWEAVLPRFMDVMSLTVDGIYFTDLDDIPHIDLSAPWWDSRVAEDISIAGHHYVAMGAMNTWSDSHTYAIVFNKELAADYKIDSYSYVREDKWTLDTFYSLISQVTDDINGDGVMTETDRYGACSEFYNFNVHMLGCGVKLVTKDENDMPVYAIDQHVYDAAQKVYDVMRSGHCLIAEDIQNDRWNAMRNNFRAGNVLYYVGGMEQLLIFRDLDTELGLLPIPKMDEEQEDYAHTFSLGWAPAIAVPRLNTRQEMTGVILEAMNADSYYGAAVAYFDVVMKYKAMRDQDSYEMLQIIRQSRTVDFESAFGYLGATNIFRNVMKNKDMSILSSSFASAIPGATAKIADSLAAFGE